jgi:hypothetical protein
MKRTREAEVPHQRKKVAEREEFEPFFRLEAKSRAYADFVDLLVS